MGNRRHGRTVWVPDGALPGTEQALSVEYSGENMTPSLHRDLLVAKLDALIRADPKEARRVLEMSQEHAPNFWTIPKFYAPKDWAVQIVYCDRLMPFLGSLTGTGELAKWRPQSLREILGALG